MSTAEEGTDLDDLEAGPREFGVNDMPDIPEANGANSSSWGEDTEKEALETAEAGQAGLGRGRKRAGTADGVANERVNPRTAIVSSQAVARDRALERGELPIAASRRAATEKVGSF